MTHSGFSLWRGCMSGDSGAWAKMKKYNKRDVDILELVYEKLRSWMTNHPNYGLFAEPDAMVCPNCGSPDVVRNGTFMAKSCKYQKYRCKDCRAWSRSRMVDKKTGTGLVN